MMPRWVYPRMCGVDGLEMMSSIPLSGLSPRVRGRWNQVKHRAAEFRFIPACAG